MEQVREQILKDLGVLPSNVRSNFKGPTKEELQDVKDLVFGMYRDEKGDPILLTDGQAEIFWLIYTKSFKRIHIETFTRFGKSLSIALAVLTRVATYPEKWAVVAGNEKQARIIMSYIIQHIFDSSYTEAKFQIDKGESKESIRRYKNKDKINFAVEKDSRGRSLLGEVYITNAKGALGFGAANVVEDESALIPDDEEALVFRMLGDQIDNFYCKVGNPWESGHFSSSFENPDYYKVVIDWVRGLKEGRVDMDIIKEAMRKPFFDVLYECKRPKAGKMEQGWIPLLTKEEIDRALIDEGNTFGILKLGVDVAGEGRDFSILVKRGTNIAEMTFKKSTEDTMEVAEEVLTEREKSNISGFNIAVDKVGMGHGVCDILKREIQGVNGVNAGEKFDPKSTDANIYFNLRAKMFWLAREWILKGGKLIRGDEPLEDTWYQLTKIKYAKRLEGLKGKMQVMPKEMMAAKEKGVYKSPDIADAFALTFATQDVEFFDIEEKMKQVDNSFDKHSLFPSI